VSAEGNKTRRRRLFDEFRVKVFVARNKSYVHNRPELFFRRIFEQLGVVDKII
jgi:hypothetical protein